MIVASTGVIGQILPIEPIAAAVPALTEGLSYEKMAPPCCKEVWYTAYRRFFWLLDKARK